MAGRKLVPPPDESRDWLPMRAYSGRRSFDIENPVVEPLWSGTRVLAHVVMRPEAGRPVNIALIEELGVDVADELPDLIAALAQSVMALDAIVDGVITRQVGLDGVGASAIPEVRSRPTEMFIRNDMDFDVTARGELSTADASLQPVEGFVAVDLLRIDGTILLDVPLLERKRLLESIIRPDQLVRVSAHVRPPVDAWVATWKSMGLRGGILKGANSRYRPGDDTVEWTVVERLNRRG